MLFACVPAGLLHKGQIELARVVCIKRSLYITLISDGKEPASSFDALEISLENGSVLGAMYRVTVGQKLRRSDYITGVSFYNTTEKVAAAALLLRHTDAHLG